MKIILSLLFGLLPASKLKNWLLNRAGHRIASSAQIGVSLIINSSLCISKNSKIGSLNAFRNVKLFMGRCAEIGQLNWISSAPFLATNSTSTISGSLILSSNCSITNRHYLDASGGIRIGKYSTVAGVRSVFMTHGIDVIENQLISSPISIGEYCMIGGSSCFVLGSKVPNKSIVAMGSTVIAGLREENTLYAGVPAISKKEIDIGRYGIRTTGPVPPKYIN